VTQLDVRPGAPPCASEDLIEEARRHHKRRIRVIAISTILFALIVAATVVGLTGQGGGGGGSGSSHAQAHGSQPHGNGPPLNHKAPNGTHPATAAPKLPQTSELPLCIGSGLTIPPGALACRVTGIHPDAQASEPWGWAFGVTNAYAGTFEGQYITVYAGSTLAPDPTGRTAHGVPDGSGIRITVGESETPQQFLLPGNLTPLTITSVSGNVVTLQLPDSATVTFNLATDTYS
jgi:hypothetical protein